MKDDGKVWSLEQMTERGYLKFTSQKNENKLATSYLEKENLHVSFFVFDAQTLPSVKTNLVVSRKVTFSFFRNVVTKIHIGYRSYFSRKN